MALKDRVRAAYNAFKQTQSQQPGATLVNTFESSMAGVGITEDSAMRFATVHACVRVLSEDIASLSLHVYKRTGKGKERARDHPLYHILHNQPNPEMTPSAYKEAIMVNVLLTGNGYSFIEYDRAGRVRAIWPLLSSNVHPFRDTRGEIRYQVGSTDYSAYEIHHIKGISFDGLLGLSPISYARESIGLGIAAEQFGSTFFKNGTHVGGIITIPGGGIMSDPAFERTQKQFKDMYKGLQNSHSVPILEGGATFTPIGIPPEDAQFLETRKFQRSDIAAIYRVPPHMIGDLERATFSNIEHQDIAYLRRTLLPWLVRWEQESNIKYLPPEERKIYVVEHDTAGFMRGDTQSRMNAYATAIQNGIMSPNDARVRENLNEVEGGDVILLPMNMRPADEGANQPIEEKSKAKRIRSFPRSSERRAADDENAANRWSLIEDGQKQIKPNVLSWLSKQAVDVKRIIEKVYGTRDAKDVAQIRELLRDLYVTYKNNIPKNLRESVTDVFLKARKGAFTEIGLVDMVPDWYDSYLEDYLKTLADRINGQNYGELARLLEKAGKAGEDVPDTFYRKLSQWGDAKAKRIANYESSRAVCSMTSEILRANGYEVVWVSGMDCCPGCQKLNGRTVAPDDAFANKSAGYGGIKRHPPLHKACNCTVKAGAKIKQ